MDAPGNETSQLDIGVAGASARREHQRRRGNRERKVRERHPRIGKLLLALADEPLHQEVWARGALGEEHVARFLAEHVHDDVVVLHDRRLPGRRSNIDHIAVAASGVWVIDSKRYRGRVAVVKPLFGDAKLTVAGRDRTKLIQGLAHQVALVERAMSAIAPDVPVRGTLCFVDADLPRIRTPWIDGHPLLSVRRLARRLNDPGPLSADRVRAIAAALADRFRSA